MWQQKRVSNKGADVGWVKSFYKVGRMHALGFSAAKATVKEPQALSVPTYGGYGK
jgi:hypothetical protein